jgi:hypothetical protein
MIQDDWRLIDFVFRKVATRMGVETKWKFPSEFAPQDRLFVFLNLRREDFFFGKTTVGWESFRG